MKAKLLLIGLLMLLVAGVTGCGGAHRYDGRLVAVDSLMKAYPDSALALVEALSPDSLHSEGDRAYRDLLLTQARYKCYITATSDSDINRALNYYRHHSNDREKLTRAYIYKGAVMEELNHPDSAMYYYKTAEATADENDYFQLGYINLRIGELYQSSRTTDSAVIDRMTKAAYFFEIIKDTSYLITTIGTKGIYFYDINQDSARRYLEKAITFAQSINSPERFRYQSKLAGIHYYNQDYEEAIRLSTDIIKNGKDECDEYQFYYYAALSLIKISRLDSAYRVKSIIPAPLNIVDSMNHFMLLAELAKAESNLDDFSNYNAKAIQLNKSIYKNAIKSNLSDVELKITAIQQKEILKNHIIFRFVLILLSIFILLIIILLMTRKHILARIKSYQNNLISIKQELEETIKIYETKIAQQEVEHKNLLAIKESEIADINKLNQELKSTQNQLHQQVNYIVRLRKAALYDLYQDIRVKTNHDKNSKKRILPLLGFIRDLNDNKKLLHFTPRASFWEKLELSIDYEYPGLITFVRNNYPSLTIKDIELFMLLCAEISPQIIKLCMNLDNVVTVSNYKRKLIKEKIGLDMKFENFIKLYEEGKLIAGNKK